MILIISFELCIEYSTLAIWDPNIDQPIYLHFDEHYSQGFAWIPGNVNLDVNIFDGEVGYAFIEVWQAKFVRLQDDSVRAILVPFSVGDSGIVFSSPGGGEDVKVLVPEGDYALVFEIKLRSDEEYLNSSRYQEDLKTSLQSIWCRFTFIPRENNVEPEILRADEKLTPIYPLLMKAEFE
jgi:hypothetical protein